jgi:hypothetical protein
MYAEVTLAEIARRAKKAIILVAIFAKSLLIEEYIGPLSGFW